MEEEITTRATKTALRKSTRHYAKLSSPFQAFSLDERLRQIKLDSEVTLSNEVVLDPDPSQEDFSSRPALACASPKTSQGFIKTFIIQHSPTPRQAFRFGLGSITMLIVALILSVNFAFQPSKFCGNHVLETGEACDSDSLPGCSRECTILAGWSCQVFEPSGLRTMQCVQ